MDYITLIQAKRQLKLSVSENSDDALIQDWITWSSGLINYWKERVFYPYRKVSVYDAPIKSSNQFGSYDIWEASRVRLAITPSKEMLFLHDDLLEILEILNGDDVAIGNYFLRPKNVYPKNRIYLPTGGKWELRDDGIEDAIELDAIWGYCKDYPNCFITSGDQVENNPLISTDLIISVNDADGVTDDLQSPRFQAGQLLRIRKVDNSFEYLKCKSVDNTSNQVTVVRGQNGTTTLASVPQNTNIEIFRPESEIVQMCIRLVQWRYRQKDTDSFDKTYSYGVVNQPSALPSDVQMILGARGKITI